jgi:hypothetical protein
MLRQTDCEEKAVPGLGRREFITALSGVAAGGRRAPTR